MALLLALAGRTRPTGLEVALFFDDSNVCSVFSRDCCHEDLFEFFDAADCF
jgi:hypothetical protein